MSDQLAFSAEWLTLREPANLAARSGALAEELARALPGSTGEADRLQVLDLATGTGANIRALAPRLRRPQDWLATDLDRGLLDQLRARVCVWAAEQGWDAAARDGRTMVRGEGVDLSVATASFDLRALGRADPAGPTMAQGLMSFEGRRLVTASALLDLLSDPQVQALARLCRHLNATVFFALTYDGRIGCTPSDPEDEGVRMLVNRHQRTDKGFGAALGPEAVARMARALSEAGYRVRTEPSDWRLGPSFADLQRQLLTGWAHAASEIAPERSAPINDWLARRLAHVDTGQSVLAVGHVDLLGQRIE